MRGGAKREKGREWGERESGVRETDTKREFVPEDQLAHPERERERERERRETGVFE